MRSLSFINNTSVLILVHIYYSATAPSNYLNSRVPLGMDCFFLSNMWEL